MKGNSHGNYSETRYAINSDKTQQIDTEEEIVERFVSGVNCHPATARAEMMAVKKRFGKEDGTVAYHGYQSFAPGEATPEIAHRIGVKLAQRLWGDRYQVVVATHLDKENHLHNHFVLNTVSFEDGIKFNRKPKDYYEMREVSDALCREYGLSVIQNPQHGKSKQYGEWRAEQEQRPTWRGIVKSDVDEIIRQSMTERQFFENLHKKGYEVHVGKDISVRPPGKPRFVRLARNFGETYTLEGIRRRILEQSRPTRPLSEPSRKTKRYRVSGNWKGRKKVTGFRALYFHYCYLLGVFPKNKQQNKRRLHFLLREDLIKLDAITQEARLLGANHIDTAQQVIFVCKGMGAEDIFRSVSKELAHAEIAGMSDNYNRNDAAFKAYSASYLLCRKYQIGTADYNFSRLPASFRESDAQGVRAALTEIRDSANQISQRMYRALDQNRNPRGKEQER